MNSLKTNSAQAFANEQERSQHEHHVPTAGAMIGHITANLAVHALKIEQAILFAKGPSALFLNQHGRSWLQKELTFWEQINRALYAEADLVPTTSRELLEYSMLEENGAAKYDSGEQQLFDLIKDFDTQLLFIDRAIKLTEKEAHEGQNQLMKELYRWIKEQITLAQSFLGNEPTKGLSIADDDEDDD